MDHLDRVEEGRESLLDSSWVAGVERLKEFLKGLEVLDIVLGFVRCLCDPAVQLTPVFQASGRWKMG